MSKWTTLGACVGVSMIALACGEPVAGPDAPAIVPDGALNAVTVQHADVMNQAQDGIVAENGAKVVRQQDGVRLSLKMPTPEPGTYVYPAGADQGTNEVFTLWAFIFNHPELCSVPCDGNDIGGPAGVGIYNVGGTFGGGGGVINIAGRIGVGEAVFGGDTPLSNVEGAEIHLAVAPHGTADPADLPGELRTPAGSPACGCWWIAIIE